MLLNRILLHKMTPHFVVLIGCIKSLWAKALSQRYTAGWWKVARTDASCNKNRSFIKGGGGSSVHRQVQSGVFVEYVVLTRGALHLGKKPGDFCGSKSGISDW